MGYALYSLFMACCMFVTAACGLMIAAAMWRKSSNMCKCICKECECCN